MANANLPWVTGPHQNLSVQRQGYTGVAVANAMNHVQRAVQYVTPRSAALINGNNIVHANAIVHPYRREHIASAQKTHDVQHILPSGAIPAGGATTVSRLVFSGAAQPNARPAPNIPQSIAWAQPHPDVSAIAANLGYGTSPMQASMSVGFNKTGLVSARVGPIMAKVQAK